MNERTTTTTGEMRKKRSKYETPTATRKNVGEKKEIKFP